MADVKKVLVVDDHFEMLEFLRSMLELSNEEYEVFAVPSAEEGLLELRRTAFDLLITDVRLPGMSGFDLVRRIRKQDNAIPVIMITAYSTAQGKQEAEELQVYRYFPKPLDTDAMITAVQTVLHDDNQPVPKATAAAIPEDVPGRVKHRLDTLRNDTGATGLILAKTTGHILHQVGDLHRIEEPVLAKYLAQNLADSFLLAEELGREEPFTIQYHTGKSIELYCANIGRDYFLALFFNIEARRGRIGTIWLFTQRAIGDLVEMLPDLDSKPLVASLPPVMADEAVAEVPGILEQPPPPPDIPEEDPLQLEPMDIAPDELMDLLGEGTVQEDEVDAFWEEIASDEVESTKGFSLEEAMRQGLIPNDLADDNDDG